MINSHEVFWQNKNPMIKMKGIQNVYLDVTYMLRQGHTEHAYKPMGHIAHLHTTKMSKAMIMLAVTM